MKLQPLTLKVAMALLALTLSVPASAADFPYVTVAARGDLNGDQQITFEDISLVQDIFSGQAVIPGSQDTADYNRSGQVTILDLLEMYRDVFGSMTGSVSAPLLTLQYGDLNENGIIDDEDATLLNVYLYTGLAPFRMGLADVNMDGNVDYIDQALIVEAAQP